MTLDARGWRIALVPDCAVNPPDGRRERFDVVQVLDAQGYGLLQLPPVGAEAGPLLAVIADQVAEYAHHGYAVVAVGLRGEPGEGLHWRRLTALLRHRGVTAPARHLYDPQGDPNAEMQMLAGFLSSHDISEEEQRIWRS